MILETITADNGVELQIGQDDVFDSPREWDNLSVLCLRPHNRYDLPMEVDGFDWADYDSADDAMTTLETKFGAKNIVPVWMYDHGQVTFKAGERTYPFTCEWDGSFAGFAFTTDERMELVGTPDDADKVIAHEVETYSQWANGEVYWYSVTTPDGEGDDSCGGFIGWDTINEAADEVYQCAIRDYDDRVKKETAEREYWYSRDVVTV